MENAVWKTVYRFPYLRVTFRWLHLPLLELHLIYLPVDHSYVSKGWNTADPGTQGLGAPPLHSRQSTVTFDSTVCPSSPKIQSTTDLKKKESIFTFTISDSQRQISNGKSKNTVLKTCLIVSVGRKPKNRQLRLYLLENIHI